MSDIMPCWKVFKECR